MDIVDVQDKWPTPAESSPPPMDMAQDTPPPTKTTPSPDTTPTQVDTLMPPASPPHQPPANEDITMTSTVTPAAPTPPRPRVGFAAANTVVEPSQTGVSLAAIVHKQLAPIFAASNSHKKVHFLKIKLPVDEKPKDPTSAAWLKLKELGKLMINHDPTTIFYKYKKTHDDKRDACTKLSQLSTTITSIQAYMFSFCPSAAGGDVWGTLPIGFDSNPVDFVDNVAQEANMQKFWIRKAPLQAADTDYAGWLYLSPDAMHLEETADSLNEYITNIGAKTKRTPFPVACERRMIWDDKQQAKDLSQKEKVAKKAMHIVCEKGRVTDTILFVWAWLKSKRFARLTNIPMKFVPNFTRGNGKVYNEQFSHAVNKHMQLTSLGTQSMTSSEFCNIETRNEFMKHELTLQNPAEPHSLHENPPSCPFPTWCGGPLPEDRTTFPLHRPGAKRFQPR
jgi:hypothetical protein